MKTQAHHLRLAMILLSAMVVCGCKTVKMPKIADFVKSPEFSEDAAKVATDIPDVKDAPLAPTDVRSDKQWDQDVRALQALRDGSGRVTMKSGPNALEAESEFEKLKAKAQAYKKDDPASLSEPKFPNYKPRR